MSADGHRKEELKCCILRKLLSFFSQMAGEQMCHRVSEEEAGGIIGKSSLQGPISMIRDLHCHTTWE